MRYEYDKVNCKLKLKVKCVDVYDDIFEEHQKEDR